MVAGRPGRGQVKVRPQSQSVLAEGFRGEYRAAGCADTIRAMPDLPSGEWSPLLVGHQWPGSPSLAILRAAAADRAALGVAYDGYADNLRSVRTGALAGQEGLTAESTRQSFGLGESRARDIAARNLAKGRSYTIAEEWVTALRSDLEAIAADGNSAICRILDTNSPAPQKISAIVQTVTAAQEQANAHAASCCANLRAAIHTVLAAGNGTTTARGLARLHGMDLDHGFGTPNTEHIHTEVSRMMTATVGASAPVIAGMSARADIALSPDSLTESFTTGTSAGAPMAVGIEALTSGAISAIQSPTTEQSMGPPTASPTPLPDTPPSHAVPAEPDSGVSAEVVAAEPRSAVAAAPLLSPAPAATATRATPARPLPGYAADLRPTMKVGAPGPSIVAAAPASAPVTAATAALAHSSVVRQQSPVAPAHSRAVVGAVSAKEVAVAAVGAAAEPRLRRLLAAVARQEPRLRWAIGDREDGSTVLVTDLAGGWIPPHVEIPTEVVLLEPGSRTGDMAALLVDAVLTADYEPGGVVAAADEADPVPMSIQARCTTPVDDLGWELARATRWREGLPRQAYTVARAALAHTGCLESEIGLLRDHLGAVAQCVVDRYPDDVDRDALGNWQLLATVDALLDNDATRANYHFAWFHAQ